MLILILWICTLISNAKISTSHIIIQIIFSYRFVFLPQNLSKLSISFHWILTFKQSKTMNRSLGNSIYLTFILNYLEKQVEISKFGWNFIAKELKLEENTAPSNTRTKGMYPTPRDYIYSPYLRYSGIPLSPDYDDDWQPHWDYRTLPVDTDGFELPRRPLIWLRSCSLRTSENSE